MKRRLSQVDTPSLSLQNSGEKPILVAKQEGNVEQQQQQQVSLFDNRPQMTEFDMLAVLAIAELASSARNGDDDNNNNEVLDSGEQRRFFFGKFLLRAFFRAVLKRRY